MKYLSASAATFFILLQAPVFAAGPVPPPQPEARLQAEMAQVPASDPAASGAPTIVSALKGVHPRILFTQADIDAIKANSSDPVMQKSLDGVKQWVASTPALSGPRPEVVAGDDRLGPYYQKAPAFAYMYALEKDPALKQKIIDTLTAMLNTDHWADANNEVDASMGAAQNMFFVAALYDAVYNDLDPDLRAKLAQKIFTMARRMYYLGHKSLELPFQGKGFWQQDPQPNHRWYRDMGLAACVLAVADEKDIDASYLMQGLKDEVDFVAKWYPTDGDCHEGAGYQNYGITPISMVYTMMDRNVGTTYLKDTGLRYAWEQQVYFSVPGRKSDISWGDDMNSPGAGWGHNDAAFFLGPKLSRDPLAQAAMLRKFNDAMANPKAPWPYWTMLEFYDPSLAPGDYKSIPLTKLLPDIGAASMRDSWDDDAVVFTFKCGPMGGYQLNEYRNTTTENGNPHGINVAHDDPDANEFDLAVGNGFAFHPGNYTNPDLPPGKMTKDHSTILVDGKGQEGEGSGFSQPIGNEDMTKFSYLTGWKTDDKGHVMIEGEAGPAYCGQTYAELKAAGNKVAPALLKTYRRTAIWMPKEYILILDNIVGNGSHAITWLGTTPKSEVTNGKGIVTTETGTPVPFQTVSDHEFQSGTANITLVGRVYIPGRLNNVPIQQLQLTANADAIKFATVLDPWKTGATVKITPSSPTTIEVSGTGYDDTWTWNDPKDLTTPSSIDGKRSGAALISLTEADKAPRK